MTYDSNRGVVVLFGGRKSPGIIPGATYRDTWEYDGIDWINKSTSQSPSARYYTSMAYDKNRGVIVLFGGYDGNGRLDDTWEYNGMTWKELTPNISPSARWRHAVVYDELRKVTVLFGGATRENMYGENDTWEYNGSTWVKITTNHSPAARTYHSMTYDNVRNVTILLGGVGRDANFYDTWEYNGNDWTQVNIANVPEISNGGAGMTFDASRGVAVYFKDYTWEYKDSNWNFVSIASLPESRESHELAYDRKRNKVVLFGGQNSNDLELNDTWEYTSFPVNVCDPLLLTNDAEYTFFHLEQNYPNPFNSKTTIKYRLLEACEITIKIYDINGELVQSLIDHLQPSGYHSINWNAKDYNGQPVSSGIYFYCLQSNEFVITKRMILLQ